MALQPVVALGDWRGDTPSEDGRRRCMISHVMRQTTQWRRDLRCRLSALSVPVIAGVLPLAMGGAIVAARVTVPVMFLPARRHPTIGFRITAAVVGSVTVSRAILGRHLLGAAEVTP